MIVESYDWFLAHRDTLSSSGSHHQSPVRLGLLRLLKRLPRRSGAYAVRP